ncbi:hypothetical protein [Nitrosomonas sp. Is37]|uniref:hypothetical protein n=1 Tax=Nitrosomonas sp. Is37 TaxID=3080535 RepID=UPI00294B92C4|nr:hypothetical protein [Nitrosomonas sp. Is37]MDV6345584.1 hypothetical protein [Nitrosomonas sp. Is37]
MPPLIRQTLLEDATFRAKYGFKADAVIVFGDSGISILRSELFDGIRRILSGTFELTVTDTEGRAWKLSIEVEAKNGCLPKLFISNDEQSLVLPNFSVLSPHAAIRLRSLNEIASDVNLPASAKETWRTVLSERPLEDDECTEFHTDLRDTPTHVMRSIRSEIQAGCINISSLVPSSRRYFDRLIGKYDGSASVNEYAAGAGMKFFVELSAWRSYEGFLFSLFLSSHSSLGSVDVLR